MPKTTAHPTAQQLSAFGLGRLPTAQQAAVEEHVAGCEACCRALRGIPDDTLMGRLRTADATVGFEPRTSPGDSASLPLEPASEQPFPPELVEHSRYRIVKQLGAGGMGTVYLAEHRMMERRVALKVINRRLTSNPRVVERFHQEVKNAAKLAHPHIVAAHDADQAGDLHFLVMEYVDGETLARIVEKRGPLSIANACMAARQAAIGLQHAFKLGMVHRDIKPQNLMLTRDGRRVKILDFGLSRLAREQATAETMSLSVLPMDFPEGLTAAGVVLGTPDYIAPEQVQNSHLADIRADIYSLGCTLYFLLSGQTPFPTGSVQQKVQWHVRETPRSLSELRPEMPADLLAVIDRMLAKDPHDRYQTPDDVAKALEPYCRTQVTSPNSSDLPAAPADDWLSQALPLVTPPPQVSPLLTPSLLGNSPENPSPLFPLRPVGGPWRAPHRRGPLTGLPNWVVPVSASVIVVLGLVLLVSQFGKTTDPETKAKQPVETARVGGLQSAAGNANSKHDLGKANAEPVKPINKAAEWSRPTPWTKPPYILLVVAHDNFWYPDYENVRSTLVDGGAKVKVGCWKWGKPTPNPSSGSLEPITVDAQLKNVNAKDLDAVVFIGEREPGLSLEKYEYIEAGSDSAAQAQKLIREMQFTKKYVTAICGGTMILAKAGILNGKQATGYPTTHDFLRSHKVDVVSQEVMLLEAERILTGQSPEAATRFAEELLRVLRNP